MPAGMPDMSSLEGMMGQGGMPDLSGLGGDMDMSQLFGKGFKGKIGQFAMKQAMKRQANKLKSKEKTKIKETEIFVSFDVKFIYLVYKIIKIMEDRVTCMMSSFKI